MSTCEECGFTPSTHTHDEECSHYPKNLTDLELARKMVQIAVWMKRQYQDAGLIVARVFCEAKGLDVDAIEREIRAGR